MNSTTQFSHTSGLIFIVVAGLVVLSMVMGRRSEHRSGLGWWIGLGLLLLIVSVVFSIFSLRGGRNIEERHSDRSAFHNALAEARDDIQNGLDSAREAIQDGMAEVSKGVEATRDAVQRATQRNGKKPRNDTTVKVVASTTNAPRNTVTLQVELKDSERSQQKDEVKQRLIDKAARSVNRWVNERMPIKTYALQVVDTHWLEDQKAFPDDVDFTLEGVPRVDPKLKDPLFGGTLKVVLTPPLQTALLDMGYARLQTELQDEQYNTQGIICICLLGLTGFLALLAFVKSLVTHHMAVA